MLFAAVGQGGALWAGLLAIVGNVCLLEMLLTSRFHSELVLSVSMLSCHFWSGIIQRFNLLQTKSLFKRKGNILFYHKTIQFNAYNLMSLLQSQGNRSSYLHGYQLKALPSATHPAY
jgi:hypothetical protein